MNKILEWAPKNSVEDEFFVILVRQDPEGYNCWADQGDDLLNNEVRMTYICTIVLGCHLLAWLKTKYFINRFILFSVLKKFWFAC